MMELEKILKLIEAVSESNLTEFCLKEGDMKLKLGVSRNAAGTPVVERIVSLTADEATVSAMNKGADIAISSKDYSVRESEADADGGSEEVMTGNVVESPLVGIFYSAPSPDEAPFVKVGDTVKKGQVIGIVEAMKLMNEIECEYDGVVKQILIENNQMVEYGQPLFVIG